MDTGNAHPSVAPARRCCSRFQLIVPALFGLFAFAPAAQAAQDFPARALRIVVSEGAGAGSDIIARQIGAMLTEAWG